MLCKFLIDSAFTSLKRIQLVFPVVGHSFIPSDRVFGHTEKDIRKHASLLTDEDNMNIFKRHAIVNTLGKDCPVYEWKESVSEVIKDPAHGTLIINKRIFILKTVAGNNCIVRGDINYNLDASEGMSILKPQKLEDIDTLLLEEETAEQYKCWFADIWVHVGAGSSNSSYQP